jgi:hypothetical protein
VANIYEDVLKTESLTEIGTTLMGKVTSRGYDERLRTKLASHNLKLPLPYRLKTLTPFKIVPISFKHK